MQETPTPKPIGDINRTYAGCLIMVLILGTGISIGMGLMFIFSLY